MNWIKFSIKEPPRDGTPILVIWYKGKQKEKQLAVAWRSLDELIYVHKIGADDEIRWWVPLTDPDEELEKDAKLQAILTKQKQAAMKLIEGDQ